MCARACIFACVCGLFQRIQFAKSKSEAIAKRDGTFSLKEKRKRQEKTGDTNPPKRSSGTLESSAPPPTIAAPGGNPNKLLLVEGLPEGVDSQMLGALFSQYNGFNEVRLVEGKGVAFVEFMDDVQSGIAMQGLNGFKLTKTDTMRLSFAK